MKSKKILSIFMAAVLIMMSVAGAFNIFAKTADITTEKNSAWLSGFYVRESSTDMSRKEMVPKADGVYSRTLGGFKTEVDALKKVCNISLDSLKEKFNDVINKLYNMILQTGLLDEYSKMKDYLITEHGIVYPSEDTSTTPVYTAVIYACLKYDIVSPITGKPVVIPKGTTIDKAAAIVVSNVLGEELPDGVTSIDDYAIESIKRILEKNGYKVPGDYTPTQVIMQYKIMIAEQQGYKIANKDIKNYTQEDIKHLDGSYYAAVIKMNYKVSPTPEDAYAVVKSDNSDSMAALILGLMIESKGESTAKDNTLKQLFEHACRLGFFNLENGFYSDVYEYDVYLKYNCKEVWLTAYAYASELGQNELDNVKMTINGADIANGKSYLFKLNGDVTKVVVSSVYNNGQKQEKASYTFNIHNGTEKLPDNAVTGDTGNKNDMPNFTIPNVDGSGNYAPLPEDIIFSPYDTDTEGLNGSLDENSAGAPAQPQSGSSADKKAASDDGFKMSTAIIIVLCSAGGVAIGAGGVIGTLLFIKKKNGHIF